MYSVSFFLVFLSFFFPSSIYPISFALSYCLFFSVLSLCSLSLFRHPSISPMPCTRYLLNLMPAFPGVVILFTSALCHLFSSPFSDSFHGHSLFTPSFILNPSSTTAYGVNTTTTRNIITNILTNIIISLTNITSTIVVSTSIATTNSIITTILTSTSITIPLASTPLASPPLSLSPPPQPSPPLASHHLHH